MSAPILQLRDGQRMLVTVESEQPEEEFVHWTGKGSAACTKDSCPHCVAGDMPRRRYSLPVRSAGMQWTWMIGINILREVAALCSEFDTLKGVRLWVKRDGSGRDSTFYTIELG